ncbi:sensor histidine kinase [Flavobacteriaceae bacterium M23B6Z8]
MLKKFRIQEFWFHLLGWICLLSFPIITSINQFGQVFPELFIRFLQAPLVFYANYFILAPRFLLEKRILAYVLISIAFLAFVVWFVLFVFPDPALPTASNFDKLKGVYPFIGDMPYAEFKRFEENMPMLRNVPYLLGAVFSLSFFLLGGVFRLMKHFYHRERITKEKEIRRTQTELQFLRTQLNPHFLFNSLNSIYSLVRNKSNDAPEAVITLSELMRYMLYEANQEQVLLKKEIAYIENYIYLQRLRLSNSENVKLNVQGNYEKKKIFPLLLITFIENAFKYGTDFKGITDVNIRIHVVKDQLLLSVKNIVGKYKKDKDNSGIGLINIENRLQLLYPQSHSLDIIKENGYYEVLLKVTLN